MSDVKIDMILNVIEKALKVLTDIVLPEQKAWVVTATLVISVLALVAVLGPPAFGIYKLLAGYIDQRHKHCPQKIEIRGSLAWGNIIFRLPLLVIGTEIICFAKVTTKAKLLRYLKAGSVLVPVCWVAYSMLIFVTGTQFASLTTIDMYIAIVPVVLITLTIFILDLTIVTAKEETKIGVWLKYFRIAIAIITGYVFSSVPLAHCFKSSIDSHLHANDRQAQSITSVYDQQITQYNNSIETFKLRLLHKSNELDDLSTSREMERVGKGITGKPNSSTKKNRVYDQLGEQIQDKSNEIKSLEVQIASDTEEKKRLVRERDTSLGSIERNNDNDHIKRHGALWSYAFTSIGSAFYFVSLMLIFCIIDALAVIASFVSEDEYDKEVEEWKRKLEQTYKNAGFDNGFLPIISTNQGDSQAGTESK